MLNVNYLVIHSDNIAISCLTDSFKDLWLFGCIFDLNIYRRFVLASIHISFSDHLSILMSGSEGYIFLLLNEWPFSWQWIDFYATFCSLYSFFMRTVRQWNFTSHKFSKFCFSLCNLLYLFWLVVLPLPKWCASGVYTPVVHQAFALLQKCCKAFCDSVPDSSIGGRATAFWYRYRVNAH